MTWPRPSTHPPKQHTHPWMGNSSQISNLQTELKYLDKLKCYWILSDSESPPPWGGGGWTDGDGGGYGCVRGVPCMHAHAHTHTHTHTRMHAYTHMHVKHAKHAKHGCLHVGGHLQFLYMYKCVCACVCMCVPAHVCVWAGHPPMTPDAPPPTCPLPRAAGSPKHQNSISPELIEIIRFCLKIIYLWTFLNSYRL